MCTHRLAAPSAPITRESSAFTGKHSTAAAPSANNERPAEHYRLLSWRCATPIVLPRRPPGPGQSWHRAGNCAHVARCCDTLHLAVQSEVDQKRSARSSFHQGRPWHLCRSHQPRRVGVLGSSREAISADTRLSLQARTMLALRVGQVTAEVQPAVTARSRSPRLAAVTSLIDHTISADAALVQSLGHVAIGAGPQVRPER